jgi:hypothetical protein
MVKQNKHLIPTADTDADAITFPMFSRAAIEARVVDRHVVEALANVDNRLAHRFYAV